MSEVLDAAARLREAANALIPDLLNDCQQVDWIYNPLDYAWAPHAEWVRRFAGNGAKTLLVGMNPGHGMGNTGVPFGCPEQVRDFLRITELEVHQPPELHPKRIVHGLDCPKAEISGRRIWTFLAERYGSPEEVSEHLYIVNHCPLWMFNEAGQNITPDKLSGDAARRLSRICDDHLRSVVQAMGIERIIGVGRYAQRCCENAFPEANVSWVPHPSPASPFANRNKGADWREAFARALDV
jgi:single-strand selective monofunctional uracil DNA glycosylase